VGNQGEQQSTPLLLAFRVLRTPRPVRLGVHHKAVAALGAGPSDATYVTDKRALGWYDALQAQGVKSLFSTLSHVAAHKWEVPKDVHLC